MPYCPKVDRNGIHKDRCLIPFSDDVNIDEYLITTTQKV